MSRLLIVGAVLAVLAGVAWTQRLELLLWAAPKLVEWRNPVGPNVPIVWPAGPTEPQGPPEARPPTLC